MIKRKAVIVLVALIIPIFCSCSSNIEKYSENTGGQNTSSKIDISRFQKDRNNFKTNLIKKGPAPQDYTDYSLPKGVKEIKYKSGGLQLKAWISEAPTDGKKHPAVVYVHGGFAFGQSDWDDAKPYLDAGFILLTPMLRGENGNPGYFEFFYGEIGDVIAAGNYLKTLTYVDENRIFLSGHSTGGTDAMLVSMLPSPYKAIATFGASPEQKSFFEAWEDMAPFDVNDQKEIGIRSPANYYKCIQKPLFAYVGEDDLAYLFKTSAMITLAQDSGKNCEFIQMKGDHFSSLEPSIEDSIKNFSKSVKAPG